MTMKPATRTVAADALDGPARPALSSSEGRVSQSATKKSSLGVILLWGLIASLVIQLFDLGEITDMARDWPWYDFVANMAARLLLLPLLLAVVVFAVRGLGWLSRRGRD